MSAMRIPALSAVLIAALVLGAPTSFASSDDALAQVAALLVKTASEPEKAEAALMQRLDAARQSAPDQSDRVWLELLVGYQSKVHVSGDHGSEDLDAVFPIGNAALGLINRLDRDLVRRRGVALIDQPQRFLDALSATSLQAEGFTSAALEGSAEQRKALRRAAADRLDEAAVATLAGELALVDRPDAALLRGALAHADSVAALHWLRRAEGVLGSKAALSVYAAAESRSELRSAAQLHAAGNADLEQAQRERWLRELADPRLGGSAAMALAMAMDGELAAQLAAKARISADPLERKRLLLALSQSKMKLGGAASALRADAEFLAKLDEETRAWFVN